jgi:hypothetical protein
VTYLPSDTSPGTPQAMPLHAPTAYAFPLDHAQFLSWEHVQQRLEQARYFWLATTRPDGRPHVTPLWGCWVDQCLYLDGSPHTRWARNLARHPAATIHLDDGNDVVILEGQVVDLPTLPDAARAQQIITMWLAKYGKLAPDPVGRGIFEFRPSSIRAWSAEHLHDGTCWRW